MNISSQKAIIFYCVLALAAMYCTSVLGVWGSIASLVILAVALGGVGKSVFDYYLRKHPIKITGYYSDKEDSLLSHKEFHGKFKDISITKGEVKLDRGTGVIYIEIAPRLGHVLVTAFSLHFRGKKDGMPSITDVKDITHPYALVDVFNSEGKTFEYQEDRDMFKDQRYYYGFIYNAPHSWQGKLSFAFSLRYLGRLFLRRTCVVVGQLKK